TDWRISLAQGTESLGCHFALSRNRPLLERLEQMDLDEAAGCCEHLHDQAEALYAMLNAQIGEENA
uniref:Rop family plasmid primer RNA-binding protein n=1 Tax=Enterobacter hormaechei TaxID=158836 RepID=UPI0026EC0AAD